MQIFLSILFIVIIILLIIDYKKQVNIKTINNKIEEKNKQIELENEKLIKEKEDKENELNKLQAKLIEVGEAFRQSSFTVEEASKNYFKVLENQYKEKDQEYDNLIENLEKAYENKQDEILAEIGRVSEDLDKISSTRAAAIQAQLREQEIQEQLEFYSLSIDETDKREINILQSIESELRDPRPIRMIIWTTYYSKKANELCARILGTEDKTGIYKITNKDNQLCYIGQAKKVKDRWREHMKCGLGIDTPANNKLYQAMKKEGIYNFTFELLEECSSESLNEKEAYYIDLYKSKDFGYNSSIGIKKS